MRTWPYMFLSFLLQEFLLLPAPSASLLGCFAKFLRHPKRKELGEMRKVTSMDIHAHPEQRAPGLETEFAEGIGSRGVVGRMFEAHRPPARREAAEAALAGG